MAAVSLFWNTNEYGRRDVMFPWSPLGTPATMITFGENKTKKKRKKATLAFLVS